MSDESKTEQKALAMTQGAGASVGIVVHKALESEPVKTKAHSIRDISWLRERIRRAADALKDAGMAAHAAGDHLVKHVPGVGMATGLALERLSKAVLTRGVRHRRESS